jgi:ABC-type glycerol-3-phosphate transport system permease component
MLRPWRDLPFARYYLNTAYISFLSTLGVVVSCSMVAYGFARLRFPGRDILFMVLLSTMMLPAQVTLIPRYLLFTKLGWVNSFKPLVIPYWFGTSAYNVFLLRQFFMTVPLEMDDAAKIDGCNPLGIYWRILLPMSLPALGAVAIMHFMWNWNYFLGPLIYINTYEKYTLSLGLMVYRSRLQLEMDALMSAAVQALIPALALFFVAQRYFIQGIVISGIKG